MSKQHPMRALVVKVGRPFGAPDEQAPYVLAAVTADQAIFVKRTDHRETLGSMLWRADEIRQQQILRPDSFLEDIQPPNW